MAVKTRSDAEKGVKTGSKGTIISLQIGKRDQISGEISNLG